MSEQNNQNTAGKAHSNKNKKRKRPVRLSPEEQLQQERLERYNKLIYMSTKAIHKEAKVVKSFECQKIARRLKEKGSNKELLEQKLQHTKGFSLEEVVKVCQKRMGLPNLNPEPTKSDDKETEKAEESKQDKELCERMLKHKRLVATMDTWNEKVTEYRRWLMRREDSVNRVPDFMATEPIPSKKKKKKQGKNATANKSNVPNETGGMFVTLSGAQGDENNEENPAVGGRYSQYGPGVEGYDEYADIVKQKKNRAGQRQRKAKALAIQAKKEGKVWDSSMNWREKKATKSNDEQQAEARNQNDNSQKPVKAKAAEIASMGKEWKDEGKAHPSWAAKQTQKAGIVAFAGKKITFD